MATQAIARLNRDGAVRRLRQSGGPRFPVPHRHLLRQRPLRRHAADRSRLRPQHSARWRRSTIPFRIVAELDSPAQVSVPGGAAFGFNWGNSARQRPPVDGFSRQRLGRGEKPDRRRQSRRVAADKACSAPAAAEAHMRKSGDDLDLAASFTDADIDPKLLNGGELPPLQGASRPHHQGRRQSCAFRRRQPARPFRHDPDAGRILGRNGRPCRSPGRSPSPPTASSTPT